MIATTAKLRELLEASDYGEGEAEIVATSALCTAGPDLARLVVTLATALTTVMAIVEDEQEPPLGATLEATIAAHAALAAGEELEL